MKGFVFTNKLPVLNDGMNHASENISRLEGIDIFDEDALGLPLGNDSAYDGGILAISFNLFCREGVLDTEINIIEGDKIKAYKAKERGMLFVLVQKIANKANEFDISFTARIDHSDKKISGFIDALDNDGFQQFLWGFEFINEFPRVHSTHRSNIFHVYLLDRLFGKKLAGTLKNSFFFFCSQHVHESPYYFVIISIVYYIFTLSIKKEYSCIILFY